MICGSKDSQGNECVRNEGHSGPHYKERKEPLGHHCHARGCEVPTKPEMLMCLKHWRMVPKALQTRVWATYRHGQCDDKNPSREWHEAADAAIEAVHKKEHPKQLGFLGDINGPGCDPDTI